MTNTRNHDILLLWSDNTKTTYDVDTLQYLRKNSPDGTGSLYLNDHVNQYQKPRDIIPIDPALSELQRKREEAKLTRSASVIEKKTPANLRLHKHYRGISSSY